MAVEDNKAAVRRYADELTKGNAGFAGEYLAPGALYHGPSGDWTRDQFLEFHRTMMNAFPDARMTVEDQIAEGDRVVTRWTVLQPTRAS